jgi:hypothetical protein
MTTVNTVKRPVALVLICLATGATASDGPACGTPIDVADVLVIDTQDENAETQDKHEVLKTARMKDGTWPFKSEGSQAQTVRMATRYAAIQGCDVLVLGPMTQADWQNYGPAGTSDGRGGGNVEVRKYLALRFGVRAQPD